MPRRKGMFNTNILNTKSKLLSIKNRKSTLNNWSAQNNTHNEIKTTTGNLKVGIQKKKVCDYSSF